VVSIGDQNTARITEIDRDGRVDHARED